MFQLQEDQFPLAPLAGQPSAAAIWARVPANGESCPMTGLGHAYFHTKILGTFADGFVHVRLATCHSQKRALTLFFVPSLNAMLHRLASGDTQYGDIWDEAAVAPVPEKWLRPPVNGAQCAFTGLSHGSFYRLIDEAGKSLKTAHLKAENEIRAVRLVHLPSLHRYLVETARKQARRD
jgi:hypothetical protein